MRRTTIDKLDIRMVRERVGEYETTIRSSDDVANVAKTLFADCLQEEVWGFYLDVRGRLVCTRMIGRGTTQECPASPVDVFRPCLLTPAVSVILVHNHPSGETTPSSTDKLLAMRMAESARILGLRLLDFVIVSTESAYSLRDAGQL